ncbi:probable methyltransferase-like protein 15 homolog [Prorops nasuta]|uniref:probable methyltransferase-like protein 15 homolog n=1 Tax=Prorops nasuta TaxID=863751 RepID=UPI0034CE0983
MIYQLSLEPFIGIAICRMHQRSRIYRILNNAIIINSFPSCFNSIKYFSSSLVRMEKDPHLPVMVNEVLQYLKPMSGQTIVDMTFGAGGHSKKILESWSDIKIIALDRDPIAYSYAEKLSEEYPGRLIPLLGRFSELPKLLEENNIRRQSIDGFLCDFGCSSMQFDTAERGFSLAKNGPLDMRMDGFRCPNEPSAADVLERASEEELARIIKVYGDEKRAKKIARAIVEARYSFRKLKTTHELAKLIEMELGEIRRDQLGRFSHCATKTFQALRIFVNNELNEINYGMLIAREYLKVNGRLVAISFHSLEDTIVKKHITGNMVNNLFKELPLKYSSHTKTYDLEELQEATAVPWKMMHKHVITPSDEEVARNPRARSAKLRE